VYWFEEKTNVPLVRVWIVAMTWELLEQYSLDLDSVIEEATVCCAYPCWEEGQHSDWAIGAALLDDPI
jgi:hypothetical protein